MSANQELFKILEKIGNKLDISLAQYELATSRYKAVGKYLAYGIYCNLGQCFKDGEIYPHGSIQLETVVRPIGQEAFDIDLVFFVPNISSEDISPKRLKELIGNRLKEHKTYKDMLKETNRGWCIVYADEFHLDITPSLNKEDEPHNDSELVADKKLEIFMPSNPKDYSKWFDKSSIQIPIFPLTRNLFKSDLMRENSMVAMDSSATVTELPKHTPTKLLLKRFVQIFKRHRDVMFREKSDAPISIIITTLATKSYLHCIENFDYNDEYELMLATLYYMDDFIVEDDNRIFIIDNPTVEGENFAEKWNEKPIKEINFRKWHTNCQSFFIQLHETKGQNIIFDSLEENFGQPAKDIYDEMTANVNNNRINGVLGLGVASTITAVAQKVKPNNFYGK